MARFGSCDRCGETRWIDDRDVGAGLLCDSCAEALEAEAEGRPHIYYVRKSAGIAGQFEVRARVGYPNEEPREVTFIGSVYGGPVVMRTDKVETFVTDPGRFGEFGTEWARRFFEAAR